MGAQKLNAHRRDICNSLLTEVHHVGDSVGICDAVRFRRELLRLLDGLDMDALEFFE